MKAGLIVAAGAAAFTGGCASLSNADRAATYGNIDTAKVAAIENAARARGVLIQWINYPRKKSSAVGTANAPAEPAGS